MSIDKNFVLENFSKEDEFEVFNLEDAMNKCGFDKDDEDVIYEIICYLILENDVEWIDATGVLDEKGAQDFISKFDELDDSNRRIIYGIYDCDCGCQNIIIRDATNAEEEIVFD